MTGHEEFEEWLHPLLDRELDAANAQRVEAHLKDCPHCAALYAEFTQLRAAVRRADITIPASAALEARVRAALSGPAKAKFTLRRPRLALFGGPLAGAALAAALMLAIAPRGGEDLGAQLVDGHVRSLMANHLVDVAASDHHVVKPWFAGHIDFSPPIYDIASQGFPLAGGRVDYVDNHPVAAVVYRHGAHVINLFIWPERRGEGVQPRTEARAGYNVRHWTNRGMSCWAVSDASADELAKFEGAIKSAKPL